jgi:hypothetical protein
MGGGKAETAEGNGPEKPVSAGSPRINHIAFENVPSTSDLYQPSVWRILEWMQNDPRTRVAPPLPNHRDPFEPQKPKSDASRPTE